MRYLFLLAATGLLCFARGLSSASEPTDSTQVNPSLPAISSLPDSFAGFVRDISPLITAKRSMTPKQYRQIEPSLYYLSRLHAETLAVLPPPRQLATLVKLAEFIDRKREATGQKVVIGPNQKLIGLLDPARGLDRKEITTIAASYGAQSDVFKQEKNGETIRQIAGAFLSAVSDAAASSTPTTIVVLGHGSPEEIQSYAIPFGTLADSLIAGRLRTSQPADRNPATVNLSHIILICDDCFSTDFQINLAASIEKKCAAHNLPLDSLPFFIAGTNRDRVGHADVGEKFVPHFWREVIQLFYIRLPRPKQVTLRDFFEKVDNTMYGYGRTPIVEGGAVIGYHVNDPEMFQDPVFFIPLDLDDLATLRAILGLDAAAPLPRAFDIG